MKKNKYVDRESIPIEKRFKNNAVKSKSRKRRENGEVKTIKKATKEAVQKMTANGIHERIGSIDSEIRKLRYEKSLLINELKSFGFLNQESMKYFSKSFVVYVLRLEDGCWYVGVTRNLDKRLRSHINLKGSQWTKKHKFVELFETRKTNLLTESEAAKVEDQVTIEYATKYCAQKVRGGGYCQIKVEPKWPEEILDYEKICSHTI
jgi:predicted GIY-YIG superfamily endonuclease